MDASEEILFAGIELFFMRNRIPARLRWQVDEKIKWVPAQKHSNTG
jgi:hypothetical protein